MNTLETLSPIFDPVGTAILGTILFTASALSIHFGRKAYSEPIPNFTAQYTNGPCPALALLYNGIFALCMATGTLHSLLPQKLGGILGLIALPCALIFVSGYFIWFPRFLLPRWYPRAVKAGVPRHDPLLMGAFKALPRNEQLELLHHTAGTTAAPVPPPVSPPAPHPVSRSGSAARFQTPRPVVVGQDAPATGISRSLPGIGHENTTDHGSPEEGSR